MPIELPILTVIFGAVFMQSLVGFGSAMVAMVLLPQWMSFKEVAPLVTLMAVTLEGILLVRYRAAVQWRSIWQLALAMAIGAPIGVWALGQLDSRVLIPVLGSVVVAYALYALLDFRLPELLDRRWAWGFGVTAGVLEGLFSFAGPPVIIYGQCRRWTPNEFKGNLQALFLLDHLVVITSRVVAGAYTMTVLRTYLISLPAIALGIAVGLIVAGFIRPGAFRKLALITLLVVGARLFF